MCGTGVRRTSTCLSEAKTPSSTSSIYALCHGVLVGVFVADGDLSTQTAQAILYVPCLSVQRKNEIAVFNGSR